MRARCVGPRVVGAAGAGAGATGASGLLVRLSNGRGRGETDIAGHQGPNKIIAFVADLGGLEASDGIQQAQRLEDIIPGDATDLHVIR